MDQRLQLNIEHGGHPLHYLVEVLDAGSTTQGWWGVEQDGYRVQLLARDSNLANMVQDVNVWTTRPIDANHPVQNDELPEIIPQKRIRLNFPVYSIESFYDDTFVDGNDLSGLYYVLTAYTFVNGRQVVVGSFGFTVLDSVATPMPFRYKGQDYKTMVEFNVVDPAAITYEDDWVGFRRDYCEEPEGTNNTGSVLHFDLHVVRETTPGTFIETVEFKGCSGSVPFSRYKNADLKANLQWTDTGADMSLVFNEVYNGDLNLYMEETYDVHTGCTLVWELLVRDSENVWLALPHATTLATDPSTWEWPVQDFQEQGIRDWSWWKPGMVLQGCVYVFRDGADTSDLERLLEMETPVVEALSNEVPITPEVFRFIPPVVNELGLTKLNLDIISMQEYNVPVVNKVTKNIIKVNRPEDYKANILRPVFIRSVELKNIVVHPEVTENLSLGLNRYKSAVSLFWIRIEGVDFVEIGRTDNTVVFKVDGSLLANEQTSGTYYILNENKEVVTSGNYRYE